MHMDQTKAHMTQKARALEAYLVAAARTGDAAAADRLVRLLQPRLLAHAYRLLGDAEGARDVTQSAWIDIFRGLRKLRVDAAFRSYALQIVTRKVAQMVKTRQHDRALALEWEADAESATAPIGDAAADAQTVRAAIAALPPPHQAVLALFYLDDMTVPEVAIALDIPAGTVKTRLMHARQKLRVLLEGEANDEVG